MALDTSKRDQLLALLAELVNSGPSIGGIPGGTSPTLVQSAPATEKGQTPWQAMDPTGASGTKLFGPAHKPAGYDNAIILAQVSGGGTVNLQVQDSKFGGGAINVVDPNGTQTAVANKQFQIQGVNDFVYVNLTAINGGTTPVVNFLISFTNGTRPLATTDTGVVAQGSPNTSANGWPVKLTDGVNTAVLDNSAALETSQYAKGSGVAGDTAVRIGTVPILLANQSITSGTPVNVYTPTATFKFVLWGGSISVDHACALLIQDGTGATKVRTPKLNSNTAYKLQDILGNGLKSLVANTSLFLDTDEPAGTVVVVSGTLVRAGDE